VTVTDDDTGQSSGGTSITVNGVPVAPAAPSNLVAASVTSTSVTLRWNDNSNNETGFVVERCSGSSRKLSCTAVGTPGANVTTFTNTGLSPATSYQYRVKAVNSTGSSAYSNMVTAKTARK
jgi:titin